MFTLIESKAQIAKAQRKLEATIGRDFTKKVVKNIGYPGGTEFNASVLSDGAYWYWSSNLNNDDTLNPRRLNWFGLVNAGNALQISVEINTAYEGRNDKIAGFFARDTDTGAIYLMHSGRIGGGTKGVGKSAFLAWSGERHKEVIDSSGGILEGLLVMPIEGIATSRSAIRYIDTIAQFKLAVRKGVMNTPEFQRKKQELDDFYAEARGRRKGRRTSEIDYLSRHGDVVDALHSWRTSSALPKGGRIVKNILIDMGVAVGGDLVEVFEVKTSTARSDVYGAIGQLMVHGKEAKCRRVIILPHDAKPIATDIEDALKRLRIELVKFRLDERKADIV